MKRKYLWGLNMNSDELIGAVIKKRLFLDNFLHKNIELGDGLLACPPVSLPHSTNQLIVILMELACGCIVSRCNSGISPFFSNRSSGTVPNGTPG
jgi:hypothetical protein